MGKLRKWKQLGRWPGLGTPLYTLRQNSISSPKILRENFSDSKSKQTTEFRFCKHVIDFSIKCKQTADFKNVNITIYKKCKQTADFKNVNIANYKKV